MEERSRRSALGKGIILILLGGLFLLGRIMPGAFGWIHDFSWPLIVMGIGIFLLILGAITGTAGMAVPAAIVGGIGALLYWQNTTGNWQSWAYAWTLIPGFVGVGILLTGILEGKAEPIGAGLWLILISLFLFAIFGAIMAPFVGGPVFLGRYWPVLLILLGLLLLGQALYQRGRSDPL